MDIINENVQIEQKPICMSKRACKGFFIIVWTEETFDEIFALLYDCYTNITLMSETDEKYHKELYKEYKL